jgi:tetratricopeptide (TPR) repeat protein
VAQGLGKETTLPELFDRAAKKLRLRQNLAPEIEARLCSVIGRSYELNGNAEQGLPFLQRAFELYQAHTGPDADATLASLGQLASGYHALGQFDQAISVLLQATELTEHKVGPDHPDTLTLLSNLAGTYRSAG